MENADESLVARAVRRRSGDRHALAEQEVQRILDAGLELARAGAATPKVADIVRLAGVSNDAFYRAFRSKDDLMAAIADDGARRLLSYIQHQRDKASDPAEQVRLCLRAVLRQADAELAAASRAVVGNARRASPGRELTRIEVEPRLADILVEPLRALGSADAARDGLVIACAALGLMEHFMWTSTEPEAADVEHLCEWALRCAR